MEILTFGNKICVNHEYFRPNERNSFVISILMHIDDDGGVETLASLLCWKIERENADFLWRSKP